MPGVKFRDIQGHTFNFTLYCLIFEQTVFELYMSVLGVLPKVFTKENSYLVLERSRLFD